MHPLDSLAAVRLAEQRQRILVDLRAADQRRAAASMATRLRAGLRRPSRPLAPAATCGTTARHADPA